MTFFEKLTVRAMAGERPGVVWRTERGRDIDLEIFSPLPANEVAARLDEKTGPRFRYWLRPDAASRFPMYGNVYERRFSVALTNGSRNTFAVIMRGVVDDRETGSVLRIANGVSVVAILFELLVGGFLSLAVMLSALVGRWDAGAGFLGVLLLGVGSLVVFRYLARREAVKLLDLLTTVAEAAPPATLRTSADPQENERTVKAT